MSGDIIACARRLDARGFMPSKSGNVSARTPRGFRITPAAVPYASLREEDVVECRLDGAVLSGRRRPSSEWQLHATLYATRPELDAVVHTHSPDATALSCARQGIPPFHYMVLMAGGSDIRCAAHATFGTPSLAEAAAAALEDRRACLLANHGVVAAGPTLAAAEALALEVENLAGQFLRLLAAGLRPMLLEEAEVDEARRQFATYRRG